MKVHEYQAKEILAHHGVPTPKGKVVQTPEEAAHAFTELGGPVAVVKAQVHAGGRGKGGGVRLVRSPEEASEAASAILEKPLVTPQTGPEGCKVQKLLVEEGLDIATELYLGLVLDRAEEAPVVMASTEGGVEIEEVAQENPDKILKVHLSSLDGINDEETSRLAKGLGLGAETAESFRTLLQGFVKAGLSLDSSLCEINPLVVTGSGNVIALDAKMNFDDNALFRHPQIADLRDLGEEDPDEVEAGKAGLSYIKLDGNIGCMVNGAGLAMGTMDIIKHHGGEPANFLDVGGGADKDQVKKAFQIILSDPKVQAVLVNIFGGIMKCDTIANGILGALTEIEMKIPLVVRLEGTNVDKGKEILRNSGLELTAADDFDEAARLVVKLAQGGK
ncbi:MAG: ADP-forming succinate--CoA ligase subunit beta [Planctomycetota bacterium]|nr:ADP-forming succinate--CoA ligase subunit beta [Planctomycetota bacterium]